jgi:hypothetical protein
MLTLQEVDRKSSFPWDDYVHGHPRGTLFHTSEWLEACARTQGARLVRLGFLDAGKPVGIFPVFLRRFGILQVAASPMKVEDSPYMGPLWTDESHFHAVIAGFDRHLRKLGVHFIRFHSMDRLEEGDLPRLGYHHILRHTHVIDLTQGETGVWKRMQGSARRNIRKAEKSGVEVTTADPSRHLDTYLDLATRLYMDQSKTLPNTAEFYRSILSGTLARHTELVVARAGDRIISAAILMVFKDRAFYLDGANDKRFGPLNGSAAVQWFLIRRAMEKGCRLYDFVGSDLPWIARFKAKFGGELVQYSLFEKARPSWVFPLRRLYGSRFKPLAQKLRASLVRVTGW